MLRYFYNVQKEKIRELAYNFDVDGYLAPDMTILAEHITESGITQMTYQQEPNQIVWGVRDDGEVNWFNVSKRTTSYRLMYRRYLWWSFW